MNVPDPSPPVEVRGLTLPALHQKLMREGPCHFRELKVGIAFESEFRAAWAKQKRDWLARGFSLRLLNGSWILQQWLLVTPSGYALTQVGREKLAEIASPQQAEMRLAAMPAVRQIVLPDLPSAIEAKLRGYQITPAKQIYRALMKGREEWGYPGAVDFSDMGTGKTFQTLAASIATGKDVAVLCPTVGSAGWQRAFDHFGITPHFVSTYEAVRGGFRNHIATMDGAGKFTWKNPNEIVLILDEAQACFPKGTLIATELGPLPIDYIVENKLSIRVKTWNFIHNVVCYRSVTNWFVNPPTPLVKVHHEHGEVTCTGGHKFWTQNRGWVPASELTQDDTLQILLKGICEEQVESHVLQSDMLRQTQSGQISRNDKDIWKADGPISEGCQRPSGADVLTMQSGLLRMELPQAALLLSQVPHRGKNGDGSHALPNTGTKTKTLCEDEFKQSNEEARCVGENEKIVTGPDVFIPWRQRAVNQAAISFSDGAWASDGICNMHGSTHSAELPECSESLQGGYCRSSGEACNRGGRIDPQAAQMEILGQAQDCNIKFARVVSVEVLESAGGRRFTQGSSGDSLYDFEVEETHCYYASGVLVHNCRHDDTLTVRCCSAAIRQGIPIIVASATIATSPLEMRFAGRIVGLHGGEDDWHRWLINHGCEKRGQSYKWDGKAHHLQRINTQLFPWRGARVRKQDLGDECPETIIETLPMHIPEAARIEQEWRDTEEMLNRLARQMSGAQLKMKEQQAHMKMWQRCEMALVPHLAERIKNDVKEGNSVAVFMSFNESRIQLSKLLNTTAGFYGGQPLAKRQYWEKEFQADRQHILVNNIGAGGASVSLHDVNGWRARIAYILPTDHVIKLEQATGRVDRVGGKSLSRQYIPFVAGSMTEKMIARTRRKMANIATINDGAAAMPSRF